MAVSRSRAGREDLAVLFSAGALGILSDAELLARFAGGRGDPSAEAAFATLVDRHGPMVLGVCRRVTGDRHAAEDAFQATFVVLARKAHAVRLEEDDSLGRWLHGVGLRVARRARALARGRPGATRDLDGLDPVDPSSPPDPFERDDLRAAIDAEIARLPARYRSAVVLCHLEGLSQEQAARRLRCPVGTLQSRLHRARGRLRSGLARRGLTPGVGIWEATPPASIPAALAGATTEAASRIAAGRVLAETVSTAVVKLAGSQLRSMLMSKTWVMAGLVALGLATTGGAIGLARVDDEPRVAPPAEGTRPTVEAQAAAPRPEPPLAEKFERLKGEHEAANRAFMAFYRGSTIPEQDRARAAEIEPDFPAFARRVFELAATAPRDPAVRDIMLWMIERGVRGGGDGPRAGEFALAANWLARYFGDDPEAVRVGLGLDNDPTANRDNLLLNLYASARGRESKGLARLALAQYLERKAMIAEGARELDGPPTITHDDIVAADGSLYTVKQVMSDWDYAYVMHLKQCDVGYLRAEAERLYEEVIAEYADVPYFQTRDRTIEALSKQPEPKWNGRPLAQEDVRKMVEAMERRRSTLGRVAEARLDDWHNLAVGKFAPEIKGVDVDGKPLTLSDYRGQVVAVVFWASGCGPCLRDMPRENALAGRMKGRPFVLLGVNMDADADAARKVMEAQGVTWPTWRDEGPIAQLYHVRGIPTVYVIDAGGKIRSKKAHGESLDRLVEELVAEREAAGG